MILRFVTEPVMVIDRLHTVKILKTKVKSGYFADTNHMVKHEKFSYYALLHYSVDLLLPFIMVFRLLTVKRGKTVF